MKLNQSPLYYIHALNCRIEHEAETLLAADGRINYAQYKVLVAVAEADRSMVSAVAQWIGISVPTASHLCHKLAGNGLLSITSDGSDQRVKRLKTTSAGEQVLAELTPKLEQAFERRLGGLSEAEMLSFMQLSSKILEELS